MHFLCDSAGKLPHRLIKCANLYLYVSSPSAVMGSPSSSVSEATRVAFQLLPSFLMTKVKATIWA